MFRFILLEHLLRQEVKFKWTFEQNLVKGLGNFEPDAECHKKCWLIERGWIEHTSAEWSAGNEISVSSILRRSRQHSVYQSNICSLTKDFRQPLHINPGILIYRSNKDLNTILTVSRTPDGEIAVYSPEVAERAVIFQQELLKYSKRVVALCNSEYMVQNLNHVATQSGIIYKATHLYGKDKEMVGRAYVSRPNLN